MIPERVDWNGLERLYGVKSEDDREDLKRKLRDQKAKYNPDGWCVVECHMMDSHQYGRRSLLVYGPSNTHKSVPEGLVTAGTSVSSAYTPIAFLQVADLPLDYKVPTDAPGISVSEIELHGVKVRHGDEIGLSGTDTEGYVWTWFLGRVSDILGYELRAWSKNNAGGEDAPPLAFPYAKIDSVSVLQRHWNAPDPVAEELFAIALPQRDRL